MKDLESNEISFGSKLIRIHKRKTWVIILILIIGLFIVFFPFQSNDLRSEIAKTLNIEKEKIFINIPPSKDRYPGTVLIPMENSYFLFSLGDSLKGSLRKGGFFTINAQINSSLDRKSTTVFKNVSTILSNLENFNVEISIENAQVIELPLRDGINNILNNFELEYDADYVMVSRAIYGELGYYIVAKNEKGIATLAELKLNQNQSLDTELGYKEFSNEKVFFSVREPGIIAYELIKLNPLMADRFRHLNINDDDLADFSLDQNSFDSLKKINANWYHTNYMIETAGEDLQDEDAEVIDDSY